MADPQIINCSEDVWTLVFTGTNGILRVVRGYDESEDCFQTYRMVVGGGADPVNGTVGDGVPLVVQEAPINPTAAIKLFIMPTKKSIDIRIDS